MITSGAITSGILNCLQNEFHSDIQKQTTLQVIIWIDSVTAPPGTLYVALSQVRRLENLVFLQRLTPRQFVPVDESSVLMSVCNSD